MVIDELKSLFLILPVHDDNILIVLVPLITPQPAPNLILLLKVFELSVLGRLLKLDQNAIPFLQTVHLVLPDLELLGYSSEAYLSTQAK